MASSSVLPATGLLETIDDNSRSILAGYGEVVELQRGQEVIRQGATQDALYILLSGVLHAQRREEATSVFLGSIRPGDCFGEVNIFDPDKASAAVVAMQPSTVWRIERVPLEQFLDNHREAGLLLMIAIAKYLSRRVRAMAGKVVAQQRLSDALGRFREE